MKAWARIVTSTPVDVTARNVTGPGERAPDVPDARRSLYTETPPEMAPRHHWQGRILPEHDMVGFKTGSLTVLGLVRWPVGKNGATWVCHCACGRYCMRKGVSLRAGKEIDPECAECRRTRWHRDAGKRKFNRT